MALGLWWHGTSGQGTWGVEDAPGVQKAYTGVTGEKKERRREEENKGKGGGKVGWRKIEERRPREECQHSNLTFNHTPRVT